MYSEYQGLCPGCDKLTVTLFMTGNYFVTVSSQQQAMVKHYNYPEDWPTWEETNACIDAVPLVLPARGRYASQPIGTYSHSRPSWSWHWATQNLLRV